MALQFSVQTTFHILHYITTSALSTLLLLLFSVGLCPFLISKRGVVFSSYSIFLRVLNVKFKRKVLIFATNRIYMHIESTRVLCTELLSCTIDIYVLL